MDLPQGPCVKAPVINPNIVKAERSQPNWLVYARLTGPAHQSQAYRLLTTAKTPRLPRPQPGGSFLFDLNDFGYSALCPASRS